MTLTLHNISKSYGANLALDNFSCEFTPGIYALLGPNGSGKSTLMNIITDNLKPDSGQILFDGCDVRKMGGDFRRKLGFMPQYPGVYPNFTADEFMHYIARLKGSGDGLAGKEAKAYAANSEIDFLFEAVELSEVRGAKISSYSGGMKQRLALACAMVGSSEILILDEPTAGLDPKQRIEIRNLISRIALEKIVIIATHVVSDIEFIAQRVIMLRKGIVTDNATPHELLSKIDGMVWCLKTHESGLPYIQSKYRVTNIIRDDEQLDSIIVRVLSENKPAATAVNTAPTLEDYYLYVFGCL